MSSMVEIITKKRNGDALYREEIEEVIKEYTSGDIPDYQMAALLMAIYFQGMNNEETVYLTEAMRDSGDVVDLSSIEGIKVDKHSTGGVGDKTTLIVGPIAAAAGVPIAKMSGRGLGFTGGTIDKLESIPGYLTDIPEDDFFNQVNEIGIAVIGQTGHIAPADKKIYALRDVTATVENMSLITSSIMSKKLASGADAIVLDVKCGSGAFMKTQEDAEMLAGSMVEIGKAAGKKVIAVISDMDEPLGNAVGNSLEVIEAIDVLKNKGPKDIEELSVNLAGIMIFLGNKAESIESGISKARDILASGEALKKFKQLIKGQGGNPNIAEDISLFPQSSYSVSLKAWDSGYIEAVDAMKIGLASQHSGAGREKKEDSIDLSAGLVFNKKTGDYVEKDEVICLLYGNNEKKLQKALEEVKNAVKISNNMIEKKALIKSIIE